MTAETRTPSQCPVTAARELGEQAQGLFRSGYLMASRMRQKAGVAPDSSTPIAARLLGLRSVLVRGEKGVRLFYDTSKIKRDGAMPSFVAGPLFGHGAVHGLDGIEHETRKNAMADLAYEDVEVARFIPLVEEEVRAVAAQWSGDGEHNVYDDMAIAFGRAAFRWAGIPMDDAEAHARASQMSRLLDTFGSLSRNVVAWFERRRLDAWFESLIEKTRSGEITAPAGSTLERVSQIRDPRGELLDAKTAGVELQNLTRPTVAVARFASFAGIALVEHPEWAERIRTATARDGGLADVPEAVAFAQEVRRVYPFVPMLPGLATEDLEVQGCPVRKGDRVLIDILGTNTDPASWERAGEFDPNRFMGVDYESIETFIPQGGGGVRTGHRCPGEKIAIAALSAAVGAMAQSEVTLSEDHDDTTFSWTKILTRPSTGMRVKAVATAAPAAQA